MSGFILNRCASFKALRRFKVQELKVNFHVSRILETWKGSNNISGESATVIFWSGLAQ
jgi:hypothetical protein